MPLRITKSIEFAYPTSRHAKMLGAYKSGCWHISVAYNDIEDSAHVHMFIPPNAEAYTTPDDADLIAQFLEQEGEICPCFLKYGNALALKAVLAAIKREKAT